MFTRLITTTYDYDELNRVKSRTHTGDPQNTLPVFYYYDSQPLPAVAPSFTRGASIGRLVAVCYGSQTASAGNYTGYDSLGRANVSVQQTDGQNYFFSYGYNLAGTMTSETYPSGRMMQTDYDNAGRVTGVKRQSTEMYYAGGPVGSGWIQYAAHGAMTGMQLGNGRWERTSFNSRLQPTELALDSNTFGSNALKLEYGYGATESNSGNVISQKITLPTAGGGNLVLTQNYTYDGLNRLSVAQELIGATSQWKQTYDYDRWGNRALRSTSTYIPNSRQTPISNSPTDLQNLFDQGTNRIKATTEYVYDASGNLTSMPNKVLGFAADTMAYDAENRQKTFNGTVGQYFYDGDGRRAKKIDNTGTIVFVYNVAGQLIAEYMSGTPASGDTSYLTTDHLGSTRVVTDSGGNVKARYDYLPFGEEIGSSVGGRSSILGYGAADSTRQKFTQKERDNESGLDYFGARYYSSAQGRFTSVDAGSLNKRHLANPQKWNRYAYTINNPLKYIDPDGLEELIVIVNTFIPQKSTGPFKGDGRNAGEPGTYRTHQKIVIETDPSKNGGNPLVSHERDTGVSKGILPQGTTNPSFGGVVYVPKEDKASGNSLGVDVTRNESGVVNVHAHGNENNPLVPSPSITYNFDIKVNSEGPQGSAEVTVTGKHDRFPGYEIIVQRPEAENSATQVVYDFDPRKNGNTPMSLFPFTPKEYPNKTTPIPPKPE